MGWVRTHNADETCGIAQAAIVVGDWWNVLVLREIARGRTRFDELADELGISRRVLTERLVDLVGRGILRRIPYSQRPVRHDYVLTDAGLGLLPLLVAMQDWADRWILGDGTATATAADDGAEHARVHALVGTRLPATLMLPGSDGTARDAVAPGAAVTVLFTYPATGVPWDEAIPGAAGCTLENRLFRDAWPAFQQAGVAVHGVSTQQPAEQAAFAASESVPYPLLSDAQLHLAAALRLPTFRGAGQLRLKRLVLVIDAQRTVRDVLFPVDDIPEAVERTLRLASATWSAPAS
jgi:DNA-binding HxlR family transcriptional regulator/peroxiredoxin